MYSFPASARSIRSTARSISRRSMGSWRGASAAARKAAAASGVSTHGRRAPWRQGPAALPPPAPGRRSGPGRPGSTFYISSASPQNLKKSPFIIQITALLTSKKELYFGPSPPRPFRRLLLALQIRRRQRNGVPHSVPVRPLHAVRGMHAGADEGPALASLPAPPCDGHIRGIVGIDVHRVV